MEWARTRVLGRSRRRFPPQADCTVHMGTDIEHYHSWAQEGLHQIDAFAFIAAGVIDFPAGKLVVPGDTDFHAVWQSGRYQYFVLQAFREFAGEVIASGFEANPAVQQNLCRGREPHQCLQQR